MYVRGYSTHSRDLGPALTQVELCARWGLDASVEKVVIIRVRPVVFIS